MKNNLNLSQKQTKKKNAIRRIVIIVCAALLVGLDQLTKSLAHTHIKDNTIAIIDGVFELHYHTNPGVAFGLFGDYKFIVVGLTSAVLIVIMVVLLWGKFHRHILIDISGILILGGGIGNMIDRIFRGEVIDFLYFKLIDFPIFNVADMFVVVGAFMLIVYFIFFYSEEPEKADEKATTNENFQEDFAKTQQFIINDDEKTVVSNLILDKETTRKDTTSLDQKDFGVAITQNEEVSLDAKQQGTTDTSFCDKQQSSRTKD